jgi:hypothetical protein
LASSSSVEAYWVIEPWAPLSPDCASASWLLKFCWAAAS